jgi:NADPH-dependent ferric siderophore reductase
MSEQTVRHDDRANHIDRVAQARAGDGARKVPYPIGIRELEVLRTDRLSPGMVRLTLGGPEIVGFESHAPDEHIRLVFPDPESGELRLPTRNGLALDWPRPHPPSRVYTVRRHNRAAGEIDVDIVIHPGGLAAEWAARAAPGDRIHVAGPPGGVVVPHRYDRYLLAGDLTALPAIARWLEELPQTASGWTFIEVADATEEIELTRPRGVAVRWLHRGQDARSPLERAVTALRIPLAESLYVWMAGEAGALAPLQRWVRDELGLRPADRSITGYWKRGVSDFEEDDD